MKPIPKRLQLGISFLVGAFFFVFSFYLSVMSVQAGENVKVVVVVIDKISIKDLIQEPVPNLKYLVEHGSLGLMNTNTGATRSSLHSYITLGAGNRAVAGKLGGIAFNANEKYLGEEASDIHYSLTGQTSLSHNLVHLGLAQIIRENSKLKQTVVVGALGESLDAKKLKTAVIGNADLRTAEDSEEWRRFAVNIAMNGKGIVDYGDISSNTLLHTNTFPFSLATDFAKLEQFYKQLISKADLIVIETGDTARLDEYRDYLLTRRAQLEKREALVRIDKFIGQIIPTIEENKDLLIIISPTASKEEILQGNSLTPLIVFGKGVEPGFLTSGTTHRKGIITNLDVAPTIANFLESDVPYHMSGQPLKFIRGTNNLPVLLAMNNRIVNTSNQRPPVLKTFITLQIIALVIALPLILFSHSLPGYVLRVFQYFLLGLMVVPLILLFLPLLKLGSVAGAFWALIVLAAIFSLLVVRLTREKIDPFIILGLSTSLAILIDLSLGSPLMKNSLLGYDPMIGARFYGIGNEYSGVLLGSSILGSTALLQRFSKKVRYLDWLTLLFFLLIIFVSASPRLGTDVGGTITSIAAFTVVYLKIKGIKISKKAIAVVIISIMVLVGSLFFFDMSRGGEANTHIGRAARLVETGGWQAAWQIIERKLATNWRLIRYTIWTRVLLTSLVALAILFFRPMGVVQRIIYSYPYLGNGFIGILVASVVGLIFNDSGVVQAATTILYAVLTLVYLVIDERRIRE